MSKYIVLHTPILHGKKGDEKATRYEVYDEIDLTKEEALKLGSNVKKSEKEEDDKEKAKGGKENDDKEKGKGGNPK